jgi:predicted nucleotidyltransferase
MFLLRFQLMKPEQLETPLPLDFLAEDPDLRLAIVFGSIADGSHRPDSDIDVAVYARKKMDPRKRQQLSDDIAVATGRAVDLIDLHSVDGALLRQILHSGRIVFSKEPSNLGILFERLLDWQENFEPQLNKLLTTRLRRFTSPIHGS